MPAGDWSVGWIDTRRPPAYYGLAKNRLAALGRVLARGYLEIIRNTPLLVQLFFVYFVMAPILGIQAFPSAVLALNLFEGAYALEIFHSGIVSVPRCQWEAARSLGLSTWQVYRSPQTLRWILPPLTG